MSAISDAWRKAAEALARDSDSALEQHLRSVCAAGYLEPDVEADCFRALKACTVLGHALQPDSILRIDGAALTMPPDAPAPGHAVKITGVDWTAQERFPICKCCGCSWPLDVPTRSVCSECYTRLAEQIHKMPELIRYLLSLNAVRRGDVFNKPEFK